MMYDPATSLATGFAPQGIGADLIATLEGLSRTDIDRFAVGSHERATHAQARGAFARSLIPIRDQNGLLILDRDELIRPDSNLESFVSQYLHEKFLHTQKTATRALLFREYHECGGNTHFVT